MTLPGLLLDGDIELTDVTVATYTAGGKFGAHRATPVADRVFVEEGRKLVRDAEGKQVVSETTLYAPLASFALYTTDSQVTVNGRPALVITAKRHALGDPDVDHTEVALT